MRDDDNTPQGKLARGCGGFALAIFAFVLFVAFADIFGHLGCWWLGYSETPMASCPRWECGWFRICK